MLNCDSMISPSREELEQNAIHAIFTRQNPLKVLLAILPSNHSKMKTIRKIISIYVLLNVSRIVDASKGDWTSWLDRDNPSGNGDYELTSYLKSDGLLCDCPVDIEARVKYTTSPIFDPFSPPSSDNLRRFNPQSGLVCVRADQDDNTCSDYEVRFFCENFPPNDRLYMNEKLNPGERLISRSGVFTLTMQSDGNLVIRRLGVTLWSTGTGTEGPSILFMHWDSNLMVHRLHPWGATWSSDSWKAGNNLPRLSMQNDGNLVIYDQNWNSLWSSGTWQSETARSPKTYLVGDWHNDFKLNEGDRKLGKGDRIYFVPTSVDLGLVDYRKILKIKNDGTLEVLVDAPNDAHYFVDGYWTFCGGFLTLKYNHNGITVETYTINLADGNELVLDEI